MFLLSRYTFVFLVSLIWLSRSGTSHRYLGTLSSFEVWGNNADLYISQGQPSLSLEGSLGGGGFFLTPSGRCIFYCLGTCRIDISLPKSTATSVYLDTGNVFVDDVTDLYLRQGQGNVYLRGVERSDLFVYQGTIDALVSPNAQLNLYAQQVHGEIFTLGDAYFYQVIHKGNLRIEEQEGEGQSVISLQYTDGHVLLLRDSLVKDFESP